MKFIVLALAVIGAASATYITPYSTGYSGLGWGHGSIGAPVVTSYSSSVVTPVVRSVIAAPAITGYNSYNSYSAPLVSATPITPIVKSYVSAPITTYASAAPIVTSYSAAPAYSTYSVNPIGYGHSTILGGGFGHGTILGGGLAHDTWGVDLWKKKKAAH